MVDTHYGPKPYLVVSNQQRNRTLDTVLCVRITTSPNRPDLDSVVPLEDRNGTVVGRVLCDGIFEVHKDSLKERKSNAFTPRQMKSICDGLASALGCT
jgi:mRNA interferase MazF